ncbi:MAG: DEAD/DEAH box helicase [Bacteroidaceae bacterium]|nr:DEAD/DEAH box helicase [Bacteroidaceae bacterium]
MSTNNSITLTASQQFAFDKLKAFVNSTDKVFILKGYAGTGKTTLMRTFISELDKKEKMYQLLASTGRAAKILSNATGTKAVTVHSMIYKFTDLNQDIEKEETIKKATGVDSSGQLFLNFDLVPKASNSPECIYLIDEASMISDVKDKNPTQAQFGSGCLLRDLLAYDTNGKFVFIGDKCQLPPVIQKNSPALSVSYFKEVYGIVAKEAELTEIVRQSSGNDIVQSTKKIRDLYFNPPAYKCAKFPLLGYKNIHLLNSTAELYKMYLNDVKEHGYKNATLLCLSNRQCNDLTSIIRPSLNIYGSTLTKGDLLLVTQNNYISGLMNGDMVVVENVGSVEKRADLTFMKVEVRELFTNKVFSQFLIADVLYSQQTNITQSQQKELFVDFYYRMKSRGIKQGSKAFNDEMLRDEYLNAIRAVYGYALTCHKAQGGEWNRVYMDVPRALPYMDKPYVYQWMYTAMTRASQDLYMVKDYWVM